MFSGAVKLAGLDDYLAPSQECIKPQLDEKKARIAGKANSNVKLDIEDTTEAKLDVNRPAIQIEMEVDSSAKGHFNQINTTAKQTAAITLDDCLACSGCVTSAETVLINQQSTAEFTKNLAGENRRKIVVVSVSPQSRLSLAHHYGVTPLSMAKRLTTFFHDLGVDYVFDATVASDISLLEAQAEFVQRFQQQQNCTQENTGKFPQLPVLAGECPGWVCYAEKTQGFVLPLLSAVKSPQQVMGTLVKSLFAPSLNATGDQVYHATIMPCFDKKLEGTRPDFVNAEYNCREVDCVLSTEEVKQMLLQHNYTEHTQLPSESKLDCYNSVNPDQTLTVAPVDTGASGSYAEHVFRHVASAVFGVQVDQVCWKQGRNSDMSEAVLVVGDKPVLVVARAYGFRNIQNLVRNIKRKKCTYHYVEVMACPSGCLNGGGQLRSDTSKALSAQKQLISDLTATFHNPDLNHFTKTAGQLPHTAAVYQDLVKGEVGSLAAQQLFYTQFHAVESAEESNPLAIKW